MLWQEICRACCHAIHVAYRTRQQDDSVTQEAILNLLSLPVDTLKRARRGGNRGRRAANTLERQLRGFLSTNTRPSSENGTEDHDVDPELGRIRKATAMVGEG